MSSTLNRVELIGRLGHEPEMRYTQQGTAKTRFSLATDRLARPGEPAETDWHQVICWDKLAEIANQLCSKGRLVYVAGRLQCRTYEGRDGQPKRAVEVIASELILLDRRPGAEAAPGAAAEPPPDESPGA